MRTLNLSVVITSGTAVPRGLWKYPGAFRLKVVTMPLASSCHAGSLSAPKCVLGMMRGCDLLFPSHSLHLVVPHIPCTSTL